MAGMGFRADKGGEAVNPGNLDRVVRAVQEALGIHDGMAV